MGGKSACVHAPTGSGKTLAMVLPVVASTLWAGRGNPGRVVVLVPTRELVAQHETLLNALGAATAVVTSATLGAPGGAEALADAVEASAVVLATPAELCQVLEHRPSLYGALRCEALVCDELDLLMPSRKSNGAKVTRWQDRGDHPAEALAKLAAKRCGSSLQVLAGSATLDRASKTKLERALKGAPKVALPLPIVACDAGKNLVVKTKRAPGRPGNVRTTIAPKRVVHRSSTSAPARPTRPPAAPRSSSSTARTLASRSARSCARTRLVCARPRRRRSWPPSERRSVRGGASRWTRISSAGPGSNLQSGGRRASAAPSRCRRQSAAAASSTRIGRRSRRRSKLVRLTFRMRCLGCLGRSFAVAAVHG